MKEILELEVTPDGEIKSSVWTKELKALLCSICTNKKCFSEITPDIRVGICSVISHCG